MLKQFEKLEKREFSIEELREILMLQDKYPAFRGFNKYVIKPTLGEINELTDIGVSIEQKRRVRKVVGLLYTIENGEQDYIDYLETTYPIKEFKIKAGLAKEK